MKVMLINPNTKFNARSVSIPLGIISIAGYLKNCGHDIRLLDASVNKIDFRKEIEDFKPDIAGISVIGHKSLPDAVRISGILKKYNITVAWGGPLASCAAKSLLEHNNIDYIFTGEGELVWEELLEAIEKGTDISEIFGIAYIKDGNFHYNGQHSLANLADFPKMDFSLVNPSDYFQKTFGCERMLHICASKGCPNHCTFCYNRDFNLSQYRKRPLNDVMDEIRYLVENFDMDGIYFTDELWASTREEMLEYCKAFKESNLNFVWGCQTTIGRFTKEDYKLMYESGCRWIFFGIESGSQNLLKKMGKNIDFQKIESNLEDCYESGIVTIAAFIVGIPYETEEDLKKTVELAKRIKASYYSFNFFYPVPNSVLCNQLEKEKNFKHPDKPKEMFRQRPVEKLQHNLSEIKPIDIKVTRSYFMMQSFFGTNAKATESQSKLFFAKKTIIEAIESTLHHGFVNFFTQVFYSGREFLTAVFYAYCFPKIRKKYGLYKKNK